MTTHQDAKRVVTLLDPRIAGPVASLWTASLYGHVPIARQSSSMGSRSSMEEDRPVGVRFVVTRTEDALDSVLPCAAETLFKPLSQNKFSNASKLQFSYGS